MTGAPGKAKLRKGVSLGHAFWQIGSLTAVSRVVGFIRDIAFASFLGAGPAADAFLVALKLPNMFRRLTAEGAMTNAFLPSFAKLLKTEGRQAALGLAAEAQIILILVLFGIVILAGEIINVHIYFPINISENEQIPYHRMQSVRLATIISFVYFGVRYLFWKSVKMYPIQFLNIILKSLAISSLFVYYTFQLELREYWFVLFFFIVSAILHFASRPEIRNYFKNR